MQCRFLVPEENVSSPFSSWRPTDRNGGCWGGVSLGGMCPASEALVTAGVRAPTQPIPSVCSWGTLRPRLHRRAPRWRRPTRPASRGGVSCPGLPLFLSDGQACLGSGGRSPALACGSRAGALLFLAGVSLRTRHLLLVSGGLSRPRRPVSLVTQQCPCCCFLGALIVCVLTLKMFAFFVSSQICVIFPVVFLLSNINCSHLLVILQFHFLALRVTWKIVSFLNIFLKY